MSGVAIARYLLANNASVINQVPESRIMGGDLPLKTALPAISVKEISALSRKTVAMNEATKFITERVQVTVLADTYQEVKSILQLVRTALPLSRGTVNGFACDSILDDVEAPDFYDNEANIYQQAQDFIIKFNR